MDSFSDFQRLDRLDKGGQDHFFNENRLPPRSISRLLITAEHAGFQYRGGIGSYAQEMENLLSPDKLGIFFIGEKEYSPVKLPPERFLRQNRWIVPSLFYSQEQCTTLPKEDLVYQCLKQILPYFPDLKTVEIQDCDGWGIRIAQAKRAGLLPPDLTIRIRCHGTYVYLEQAHGKWWTDQYHLRLMAREKQAIEQADAVSFPTDFLHHLYLDSGYAMDVRRVEKLRYPLALPPVSERSDFQNADTLVFVGSRTAMKGFHLFVQALKQLLASPAGRNLKKILVLGSKDPAMFRENAFIRSLKSRLQVKEAALPRRKVLETLTSIRNRAICVLPYLGDNHPNAVLEAMACGCPLIAADRGGVPELVPPIFHEQVLCQPDSSALCDAIVRFMAMAPGDRQKLADSMRHAYLIEQQAVNQAHWKPEAVLPSPGTTQPVSRETILLVSTEHPSEELVQALEEQTRKPDVTLFIPQELFQTNLEALMSQKKEAILLTLGSDYLPGPDFVLLHAQYLERNPQTAAVSAYCLEAGKTESASRVIRPLGDGFLLNIYESSLGHSGAAFSLAQIADVEFSAKTAITEGEDLFPAILSAGGKIGVIPETLSQRRARPVVDRDFSRGLFLACHAGNLPRFESLRLAGVVQDYAAMQQSPAIVIARELEGYPFFLRLGRVALEKSGKIYFMLKDALKKRPTGRV